MAQVHTDELPEGESSAPTPVRGGMMPSRQDAVLIGVVLIGALVRVRQTLFARSIWLDEATFANAVLESSWVKH